MYGVNSCSQSELAVTKIDWAELATVSNYIPLGYFVSFPCNSQLIFNSPTFWAIDYQTEDERPSFWAWAAAYSEE